jgi:hypothetical protein
MLGRNTSINTADIAKLYAMAGLKDQAFVRLHTHMQDSQVYIMWSLTRSPFLANLYGDPRWQALLEEIGVAPHQLAEIQFNPRLPGAAGSENNIGSE